MSKQILSTFLNLIHAGKIIILPPCNLFLFIYGNGFALVSFKNNINKNFSTGILYTDRAQVNLDC